MNITLSDEDIDRLAARITERMKLQFLTVDEAAEIASVSRTTIYRYITAGIIKKAKMPGIVRIERSELEKLK